MYLVTVTQIILITKLILLYFYKNHICEQIIYKVILKKTLIQKINLESKIHLILLAYEKQLQKILLRINLMILL